MQKHITFLMLSLFLMAQTMNFAQEGTKIPFDKGVLKICSSKNFIIKGYDGKDIIIKNLNKNANSNILYTSNNLRSRLAPFAYNTDTLKGSRSFPSKIATQGKVGKTKAFTSGYTARLRSARVVDSIPSNYVLFSNNNKEQSKGLKKLGKKAEAKESGIYLKIEQKDGEIIIKDDTENYLVLSAGEKYEITIPNSIRLNWDTSGCSKAKKSFFFSANSSEIKNFKGEVEISSSLNNFKLIDVSGPVSINTIGGNVTVEFNKTIPNNLYSIYSNNGFIDITLPNSSSLSVDATASEILSDLDFDIISEQVNNRTQHMSLKLGSGKVKMKLDADLGNIYLRKQ